MKLPRSSIAALMAIVLAAAAGFALIRSRLGAPRPSHFASTKAIPPPAKAPPRLAPDGEGSKSREYRLFGVVKRIEPAGKEVVIEHEAIPRYMPAMTMPFRVDDPKELDGIEPGDAVEGTLVVSSRDAFLSGLRVTRRAAGPPEAPRPAPSPSMILGPGEEVPDFAMTDQDGEALRLSDFRGEAVVLTFIFTRCPIPTACPLMDRKFAELADRVRSLPGWADRVRLLSLSFDPDHDTPEALARHAELKGARPPLWRFAVATHPELNKVAPALGVGYGPDAEGGIVHTLGTAVIAPDGRLAWLDRTSRWAPSDVVKALKPLVARSPSADGPG